MYPKYHDVKLPLLHELERRGGSATPRDVDERGRSVYAALADEFGLSAAERERRTDDGEGRPYWEKMVRWARQKLVDDGLVISPRHGTWQVTRDGREFLRAETEATKEGQGQGFLLSPAARKEVELHAQRIAQQHFVNLGFTVSDVSRDRPYDLHCERESEEVHIEVKGTTGAGESVFLTRNEVEHARTHREHMALVIVREIQLELGGETPVASGGQSRVIWPWNVDEGILSPIQFEYRP